MITPQPAATTDEQKCALCERTFGQHYGARAYCNKRNSDTFTLKLPVEAEGPDEGKWEWEFDVTHYEGDRHNREWVHQDILNLGLQGPVQIHGSRPYNKSKAGAEATGKSDPVESYKRNLKARIAELASEERIRSKVPRPSFDEWQLNILIDSTHTS